MTGESSWLAPGVPTRIEPHDVPSASAATVLELAGEDTCDVAEAGAHGVEDAPLELRVGGLWIGR